MVRTFLCQPLADPKVFSDEYEPSCCCCASSGLILIASGSSNTIYVYSASGRVGGRKTFTFQSVGISKKLAHCSFGNYVASLERKHQEFRGNLSPRGTLFHYARVYLNWTKEQDDLSHYRIGYSQDQLTLERCAGKFSIIDIPVKYSVNDISCCDTNGNIALSTEAKVYLYAYKETKITNASEEAVIDFDCALEIDSGFQINQVSLFGSYIAFSSHCEIRAIQVMIEDSDSVVQVDDVSEVFEEESIQQKQIGEESIVHCSVCKSVTDENFVSWNIEKGMSQGLESLEQDTIMVRRATTSSAYGSPTYVVNNSCIKFEAIAQDAAYVNLENTAKEIIGPKDYIKGHPLIVINNLNDLDMISVNHMTMLYRRFVNEHTSAGSDSLSIHSVQWLPIYAGEFESNTTHSNPASPTLPGSAARTSDHTLVSLGLFFTTGRKGYLYDLMNTPKLLTEYDFTDACISACLTRTLLHVVTNNGLESYTVRLYASASQAARTYHCEDSLQHTYSQSDDGERSYTSLSSTFIEYDDSKGPGWDEIPDFRQDEILQDEVYSQESLIAVPPESGSKSMKTTTRLPFTLRKKRFSDKDDAKSIFKDDGGITRERVGSFLATLVKQNHACYSMKDLLQPCPPTSIEVCLIGIYPLRGFAFIGSTNKHVILLQCQALELKGKRGLIGKEKVMSWNVYVREISPAIDVYRDIMNLIEGSEFANPNVFHQLISEAHMILRTDLTSNTPEDKAESLRLSIRKSAVKLGDFFSRCNDGFDYLMAKTYYRISGIKLEQILLRHAKRDKDENLGTKYGMGIIDFLNEKLLRDVHEPINLPEESVYHILKIYSAAAPQLLSMLILKSRLKNIPPEKAILIMELFERSELEYRLSSLDFITLAVLHMRLCDPAHAEHDLRRLTDEELTDVISRHQDLILNEGVLTHLGQLLRRHFPSAYTNVLVLWYDNGAVSLQDALNTYGVNMKDSTSTTQRPNFKLWALLEALLNDERRKQDFPEIMRHLLMQYILWFESKGSVALLKIPHQHIPRGNGHFATRFDWLDKLPPFAGESPSPQDCKLRKQIRSSNSKNESPDDSPNHPNRSNDVFDFSQICSCCCCNSVLLKIQSLLCSQFCTKMTCETLLDFIDRQDHVSADSIKLLCFPVVGKVSDAVNFVVANHPSIMFFYAKDVFKGNKSQWQIFLECLLKTLREELYERWNKDTYLEALKGALTKLSRICKPLEFVKLLPKDGTARFFLPFIQDCYQMQCAASMRSNLVQSSEKTTP